MGNYEPAILAADPPSIAGPDYYMTAMNFHAVMRPTFSISGSWDVQDPDSEISSESGCEPSSITADTAGTTLTCEATSGGRSRVRGARRPATHGSAVGSVRRSYSYSKSGSGNGGTPSS
jgi:hypothetical protein